MRAARQLGQPFKSNLTIKLLFTARSQLADIVNYLFVTMSVAKQTRR